jgi:AcrR family transcriptional regulator
MTPGLCCAAAKHWTRFRLLSGKKTMSTPLRERRRQLLAEEILHAAQRLMAEKGHALMSMDELAAQVGISKPTLYTYFATKDELIVKAAVNAMEEVIGVLDDADQHATSPLQRIALLLQTTISRQIDQETMEPRPWRAETFEFLCNHEESAAVIRRMDETLDGLAQEAIDCGEIDPRLDKAMVVRAFYALLHALNVGHASISGPPDPTTIANMLATIFVKGVGK